MVRQNWHFCRYAQSAVYLAGHVLCSVSLLTLTTIAVERLLALRLGLRYAQVVTLKRTCIILSIFWGVSMVASTMYFVEYLVTLRFGQIGALICLIISVFSNGKIFLTLRRNQHNRVQNHTHHGHLSQTHQFSAVKYRKAVNSAFWLQVTLVVCYRPCGIMVIIMDALGELYPVTYIARQTALSLIFLNSSLNPFLYCWRIKEVRTSVKDILVKRSAVFN